LRNDTPLLPRDVPRPRRSSPRLQSFDYIGPYAYSITINTDSGRPYFFDDGFIRLCMRTLETESAARDFELIAYCFMPDHVHLLAQGLTESSSLKPLVQHFKQIAGFAFKQEHGVPLWHRSYYDRVLRQDEDLATASMYIWRNPVQAGLVQNAEDFPYSGPAKRLLGEAGRLGDDAALGGQTLRSVRTNADPPPRPA
jgi:REP-associated tyrosine transposase